VLAYIQYLRDVRGNGDSAVNRTVVVLRRFYSAVVAMGYLDHPLNPLVGFPTIKAVPRRLPVALSSDQVSRLLDEPKPQTVYLRHTNCTSEVPVGNSFAMAEPQQNFQMTTEIAARAGSHSRRTFDDERCQKRRR
jgi:site-specific recombinase XerC